MQHIHPRKPRFKPRPSDNRDRAWDRLLWARAGLELRRTDAARRLRVLNASSAAGVLAQVEALGIAEYGQC